MYVNVALFQWCLLSYLLWLSIHSACHYESLQVTNPVFIICWGKSAGILTLTPDFPSNCSFYNSVIDLLTKQVFKRSSSIWVTQAWLLCVASSGAGGNNESRRKIVFEHLRLWQGFSGFSRDEVRQWRSALPLWSGRPSHLTSDDTALREGSGNVKLFPLTFTLGALNIEPAWKKCSVSAA